MGGIKVIMNSQYYSRVSDSCRLGSTFNCTLDNQLIDIPVRFLHQLPPLLNGIADKITGFVRVAVKDIQLIVFQVEYPKGNHFFFGGHIVIQGFDRFSPSGFTTSGKISKLNRCFAINVDLKTLLSLACGAFYLFDVFKDGIGFRDFFPGFFSGVVFCTL